MCKKSICRAFLKNIEWGYDTIEVITQEANKGACIFYEKLGFKKKSVANVYHFWLK